MKKAFALLAVMLLTAATGFAQTGRAPKGVEAVDLGLPSGTKWANMNVGATSPEETGDYFRWAETKPFVEGDTEDTYLYVDLGENIAGTKYDAATAHWGAPWKMPTFEQMQELTDHCTYTWTTQNGVNGGKFTGPNGASIFLPASGCRLGGYGTYGTLGNVGSYGYAWSSTLGSRGGRYLDFGSDGRFLGNNGRAYGFPVRAVAE